MPQIMFPKTVAEIGAAREQNQLARQAQAAQLQAHQAQQQSAQEELAGKRRAMAVSMLNGISQEQDPAKQASLYATLKPMAERYDPSLKLPDMYDPSLSKALVASQISPKDQLAMQQKMQGSLPQGYRMNPETGQAEVIPGLDPVGTFGGSTGTLVRQYMDSTGASFPDALQAVQTGLRQNMLMQGGQLAPIPGAPEARGALKQGEVAGGKRAELEYDPQIKSGVKRAERTEAAGAELPRAVQKAQQSLSLLDRMVGSADGSVPAHAGFSDIVGAKNPFSGAVTSYLPFTGTDEVTGVAPPVAGSAAADFNEMFKQIRGSQFLEAFEQLKGGGHITEIEGTKATQAVSRLALAQSEEEFTEAARELQGIIRVGIERARKAAEGDYGTRQQSGPSVIRTQEEYDALPSGAVYMEDDGQVYVKP